MGKRDKKMYSCPHEACEAKFSRPYRVTDHLYSAHANILCMQNTSQLINFQKVYVCQEVDGCKKSYSNKSHLIRHINTTHKSGNDDVLYSCPTCWKTYVNRQNLKRHVSLQHTQRDNFFCDVCKRYFKKKNLLRAHMYEHTGIKSFCCSLCEADFVTRHDRKRHMRCHKTYECIECNMEFNLWSTFQKHKKAVHLIKEYSCNDCNRSFKKRSHIVRHVKTHAESSIVFKCPHENCDRFYTRRNNLKQHIISKHINHRHECVICKAQLSTKGALTVHLKKHENGPRIPKPPKTKATGRKERKDKGIIKGTKTALKLAGLQSQEEEDGNKNVYYSTIKVEIEVDMSHDISNDNKNKITDSSSCAT